MKYTVIIHAYLEHETGYVSQHVVTAKNAKEAAEKSCEKAREKVVLEDTVIEATMVFSGARQNMLVYLPSFTTLDKA